MARVAVFSCLGLGDGLISLVLSHNLLLNGSDVTTFHPFLSSLQPWFPSLLIRPFPEDIAASLSTFDRIFLFFEKSSWMQEILHQCLQHHRSKTTILNPIATPQRNYPYWEEGQFDGRKPLVDNLYAFAKHVLNFRVSTKANGIHPPEHLMHRRNPQRVLIHPTSSREGKNWPPHKYLQLCTQLRSQGLTPQLLLTQKERMDWTLSDAEAPPFQDLSALSAHIYESGYLIGNDSGLGHLASCLGIPTLTICRSKLAGQFWRPGWACGKIVYPRSWIPNLKGLRLRDRYWKESISVSRVLSTFRQLRELSYQ